MKDVRQIEIMIARYRAAAEAAAKRKNFAQLKHHIEQIRKYKAMLAALAAQETKNDGT